MDIKDLTYEESLERLKEALADLEKDELKLEESIKLFKDASSYYNHCKNLLDQAEGRVKIILEDGAIESDFSLEG